MRLIITAPAAEWTTVANQVKTARPEVNPRFLTEMVSPLWWAASRHRIDVYGMVAQSYIETGGGHFDGQVQPWFCNPCGLKVRNPDGVRQIIADGLGVSIGEVSPDHPLVHSQWRNWSAGAMVHAQHVCAYAGLYVPDPVIDPRWDLVWGNHAIRYWEELSGKWAGSGYGEKIASLAAEFEAAGLPPV